MKLKKSFISLGLKRFVSLRIIQDLLLTACGQDQLFILFGYFFIISSFFIHALIN